MSSHRLFDCVVAMRAWLNKPLSTSAARISAFVEYFYCCMAAWEVVTRSWVVVVEVEELVSGRLTVAANTNQLQIRVQLFAFNEDETYVADCKQLCKKKLQTNFWHAFELKRTDYLRVRVPRC